MPIEAMSRERRPSQRGRGMRIRASILITLMAAWLMPAGVGACPKDAHGASHHAHPALSAHSHAAGEASESPASNAPADGSTCCRDTSRAAVLTASLTPDATPRVKSLPVLLSVSPAFDSLTARMQNRVAIPARQLPHSEPFARTRRPLLI